MARTDVPGVMTGKPLSESDRVEGTAVHDRTASHWSNQATDDR
jgi:hypothetical protein